MLVVSTSRYPYRGCWSRIGASEVSAVTAHRDRRILLGRITTSWWVRYVIHIFPLSCAWSVSHLSFQSFCSVVNRARERTFFWVLVRILMKIFIQVCLIVAKWRNDKRRHIFQSLFRIVETTSVKYYKWFLKNIHVACFAIIPESIFRDIKKKRKRFSKFCIRKKGIWFECSNVPLKSQVNKFIFNKFLFLNYNCKTIVYTYTYIISRNIRLSFRQNLEFRQIFARK